MQRLKSYSRANWEKKVFKCNECKIVIKPYTYNGPNGSALIKSICKSCLGDLQEKSKDKINEPAKEIQNLTDYKKLYKKMGWDTLDFIKEKYGEDNT